MLDLADLSDPAILYNYGKTRLKHSPAAVNSVQSSTWNEDVEV